MLQETIAAMPEEDARYHMKRCIDSGLWVPDSNNDELSQKNTSGDVPVNRKSDPKQSA